MRRILITAFLLSVFFSIQSFAADVRIATGDKTGVYYPVGQALCDIIGEGCSVVSTSGSVENVKGLGSRVFEFGIVQSDIQMQALNGIKLFRDFPSQVYLRSLFSLHSEPLHLMVAPNSGIKSFQDLKGKTVNIGSVGSGSHALAELVFEQWEWDKKDFKELRELEGNDLVEGLCNGNVEAAFWVAGLPNDVMKKAVDCDVSLIALKGEWTEDFLLENPQYTAVTIPKKLYQTNKSKIKTFGPKATVLVNADVADETVYKLVKKLFENLAAFKKKHPALRHLNPESMLEDAVIAPFHPGAKKYYREKGWINY